MGVKQLARSVFPSPRAPLSVVGALPLLVFLGLFAVMCVALERSHVLLFARPAALGLIVFAVWVWWMFLGGRSGLSRLRGLTALMVRLLLLGLFVILMAEPRAVRTRDVLSVVYTLDISDSIGQETADRALEFVSKSVYEKPEEDEAGLVVFGRNAAVELPPRTFVPLEATVALNSLIEKDASNLEQALSLSAAMLPEENRGRIVLISDGTETAGNLTPILDELKSRNIAVDVLPIEYNYDQEVWVERLDLPRFVKIREPYEASVVLSSLQKGSGTLVLRENDKVLYELPVEFQAGKNRYAVPIRLSSAGYYEYAATIEVPETEDHLKQNNTVLSYIFVQGEGKVLLVKDPQGDDRDWKSLEEAIRLGDRAVEVQNAYELPRDPLTLLPYDCVVFVNVPADSLDAVQMQTVRDAVYNLGLGFLMVGGPNSFGPGGYHRTVIEEALPVSMDITKKKVLPKGALVIILHTCEFPEGNTWGKRITKQAIKVLGAQDEVGVIVYGAMGEEWLFKLTPAGDYDKMVPKINAAQIGDMPAFSTTMGMGLKELQQSDAAAKHMIIISDGDPPPPPPPMIQDFIKSMISVSTVAIFPHGGQEISKLRMIANVTGGRYYFPSDPNTLPSIFIKEAKTLKRTMIQTKTVVPEVGFNSGILKGIDSIPPLHGYVLTSLKEGRAMPILQTPLDEGKEKEDENDPILSTWRFGLGTTAAFTSDLSSNWGGDWLEWDKFRPLIKQLMTDISRVEKQGHLRLWTYTSGNEGVILVEDFHPEESFLEVVAKVSGPREQSETIRLKQVGPRRYQATVPLWGKGRYQVMAEGVAGERLDRAHGGFIVPYSPEYLRFRSNPIALEEVRKKTGGEALTFASKSDVIYGRRKPKESDRPIFDWFLIALACLVPLDVAVRRVQLDIYVIKGWLGLGKKTGESSAMMGMLLRRKEAVVSQLESRRSETPPPDYVAGGTDRTKTKKPPENPKTPPPPPAAEPKDEGKQSTTERLLAQKRRRQQE